MSKRPILALAALFVSTVAFARAQAPAGSTGQCKDGTYSTAASKDGACRGHQGVQTWYAASAPKAASSKPAPPPAAAKPAAHSTPAPAAATSGPAPAGASGQCKDGTYSNAASKDGACRGHQGVKTWFAASAPPKSQPTPSQPAPSQPAPSQPAQSQPAQPQPARPTPAPAAAPAQAPRSQPTTTAAPGGGNGQVWVNTETKVYHCSGDRYYGKTKKGAYMSQSDAQSKGFRPDAGKPCTN